MLIMPLPLDSPDSHINGGDLSMSSRAGQLMILHLQSINHPLPHTGKHRFSLALTHCTCHFWFGNVPRTLARKSKRQHWHTHLVHTIPSPRYRTALEGRKDLWKTKHYATICVDSAYAPMAPNRPRDPTVRVITDVFCDQVGYQPGFSS